jgi:hypothetical protein
LGHLLAVGLGIEGSLNQENGVFLGGDTELIVEGVMPDLLHIIPVGHNSVLDVVLQGQDITLVLGLVSDKRVLGVHTDHDTGMAGATDDGGEDGAGSIVSGKSGFAHT